MLLRKMTYDKNKRVVLNCAKLFKRDCRKSGYEIKLIDHALSGYCGIYIVMESLSTETLNHLLQCDHNEVIGQVPEELRELYDENTHRLILGNKQAILNELKLRGTNS